MPATTVRRVVALPATVLVALAVAAALVLSLAPAAEAGPVQRRERQVDHAMEIVRNQKGDPYGYGAAGPDRFDCSGLIYYAFRKAGISVPRTSGDLARAARPIKKSAMRRGDLVFFYDDGRVYHAGVFAGRKNGRPYLVHASKPGTNVKRDPIWTSSWRGGTFRRR